MKAVDLIATQFCTFDYFMILSVVLVDRSSCAIQAFYKRGTECNFPPFIREIHHLVCLHMSGFQKLHISFIVKLAL